MKRASIKSFLFALHPLLKGWEVSLLLFLPILHQKDAITLSQIGILSATFVIGEIAFSLLAGRMAIRYGIKLVTVGSLFAYGCAWALLSVLDGWSLALPFILGGVGSGLGVTVGNIGIAKSLEKGKRAVGLAHLTALGDVGRFGIAALTGVCIGIVRIEHITGLYGLVTLICVIIVFFMAKEDSHDSVSSTSERLAHVPYSRYLQNKKFVYALLCAGSDSLASSSIYIFLPLLLVAKGMTLQIASIGTSLFFVGYLAGRIILGHWSQKVGLVKALIVAEVIMAILLSLLLFVKGVVLLVVVIFLLGAVTRGTSPLLKALSANSLTNTEHIEDGLAIYQFNSKASNAVSRWIFGTASNLLGISSVFLLSSAFTLFTLVPLWLYRKKEL